MEQLIRNLAPLLGCKVNNLKWCPSTAYQVCKDLRLASLICLDVDKQKDSYGGIKYEFDNRITIGTHKIHLKVLNMSTDVLDTSYIIQSQDYLNAPDVPATINDALFFYAINKIKNDSAIYDCLIDLHKLKQSPLYKYVLLVILDSYSLRYSLYKQYILGQDVEYGELRQSRLERLINNVTYVKFALEMYDKELYLDLNHHLSTLLFNLIMIKDKLKKEYLEVGAL